MAPNVRINRHEFRSLSPPRPLSDDERALIEFILRGHGGFAGQEALLAQLNVLAVSAACTSCPTIILTLTEPRERAILDASHQRPFDAFSSECLNFAPEGVNVLLHVVDGTLAKLELYRNDLEPIEHLPSLDSLVIL